MPDAGESKASAPGSPVIKFDTSKDDVADTLNIGDDAAADSAAVPEGDGMADDSVGVALRTLTLLRKHCRADCLAQLQHCTTTTPTPEYHLMRAEVLHAYGHNPVASLRSVEVRTPACECCTPVLSHLTPRGMTLGAGRRVHVATRQASPLSDGVGVGIAAAGRVDVVGCCGAIQCGQGTRCYQLYAPCAVAAEVPGQPFRHHTVRDSSCGVSCVCVGPGCGACGLQWRFRQLGWLLPPVTLTLVVFAVVWWLCRKSAGRRLMRRGSISGVLVSSLGSFISKNESAVGPFVLTVARVVFPVDAAATMGTGNSNRSLGRTTSGSSLAYVEEEDVVFTDDETDDDDEDSDEEYAAAAAAAGDVGSGDVDAGGDVDGAVDRGDGASDATDEEARTDEMYGADVIVPGVFARAHRRRSASGDSDLSATPGIPSLHDDRAIQVTPVPMTA